MPPPNLPKYQDCHELWSKKRRRQQREQQEVATAVTATTASTQSGTGGGGGNSQQQLSLPTSYKSTSQPGSEKQEDSSNMVMA